MSQRPRIKDIAEQAGVSPGTVDRVLHERGNVASDVRERVLQVMKEIGYEPNLMARSLANNRKILRIAVILPDYSTDPYWAQPKEGIERAAEAVRHYGVAVDFHFFHLFDPAAFLETVKNVLKTQPGAILFAPLFLHESEYLIAETSRLGIPKVMINTNIEGTDALCYIGQDSYQSGVLAGRLLNFGLNDGDHALLLNLDKEVSNARHLMDKERGFKDFFNRLEHKSVEIHAESFEDFDNTPALRAWLGDLFRCYPGLNGFFVTNSRAYKLAAALDPGSLERVKIVGFDLIEPNLVLLNENKIRFLINQNAWHQGYLGILAIVNSLILKKEMGQNQYLPLDVVVKENAEYYLRRTLDLPMTVL
ncbi:MAG: LacI family DNA-binding transcriptional regulator [Saprospiraceae bacterium]|nr:LacI family DNA-binding transcriptional regulator [Saprospiraceae bacterium]